MMIPSLQLEKIPDRISVELFVDSYHKKRTKIDIEERVNRMEIFSLVFSIYSDAKKRGTHTKKQVKRGILFQSEKSEKCDEI